MGYYASASGDAKIKDGMEEALENAIYKFYDDSTLFNPLDWDTSLGWINIYDSEKYHEEDTEKFLEVIAPFITEGTLRYSGEDDCVWRFVFSSETGKWNKENATVSFGFEEYKDDELIKELEKRGYLEQKLRKAHWKSDGKGEMICSNCEHQRPYFIDYTDKGCKIIGKQTLFCPNCGYRMEAW